MQPLPSLHLLDRLRPDDRRRELALLAEREGAIDPSAAADGLLVAIAKRFPPGVPRSPAELDRFAARSLRARIAVQRRRADPRVAALCAPAARADLVGAAERLGAADPLALVRAAIADVERRARTPGLRVPHDPERLRRYARRRLTLLAADEAAAAVVRRRGLWLVADPAADGSLVVGEAGQAAAASQLAPLPPPPVRRRRGRTVAIASVAALGLGSGIVAAFLMDGGAPRSLRPPAYPDIALPAPAAAPATQPSAPTAPLAPARFPGPATVGLPGVPGPLLGPPAIPLGELLPSPDPPAVAPQPTPDPGPTGGGGGGGGGGAGPQDEPPVEEPPVEEPPVAEPPPPDPPPDPAPQEPATDPYGCSLSGVCD